jgi:polysaccharide export outer membrane protein
MMIMAAGTLLPAGASGQIAEAASAGAAAAPALGLTRYELGPGDKIHLTVYGEEGLTGDYIVSSRGMVSVPLVGDFPAAGQTISDFRVAIESRLAKGILNNPRVAAEIIEYRPFFILGEVNKPGQYPYTVGLTIYSAVATAQGFTYRANQRKVMITHAGEATEHRVRVDTALRVMPGDTVRILERFF